MIPITQTKRRLSHQSVRLSRDGRASLKKGILIGFKIRVLSIGCRRRAGINYRLGPQLGCMHTSDREWAL